MRSNNQRRTLASVLAICLLGVILYALTRRILPAGRPVNPPPTGEAATAAQVFKARADITLNSNGQTLTYTLTSRFSVFLDNEKYPVSSLHCEPDGIIGYVSNYSLLGPDRYPTGFEAAAPGSCMLRDGDFAVKIVVIEPTLNAP